MGRGPPWRSVANLSWTDVVLIGAVIFLGFTLLSFWFSGVMSRRNWSWQLKPKTKKAGDPTAGSVEPKLES